MCIMFFVYKWVYAYQIWNGNNMVFFKLYWSQQQQVNLIVIRLTQSMNNLFQLQNICDNAVLIDYNMPLKCFYEKYWKNNWKSFELYCDSTLDFYFRCKLKNWMTLLVWYLIPVESCWRKWLGHTLQMALKCLGDCYSQFDSEKLESNCDSRWHIYCINILKD